MATLDEAFARLARSPFRGRIRLDAAAIAYAREKGRETLERHAADFVRTRLAPAWPEKDGRQTPMRGHPVFVAQHATACCCRGCLEKWWKVPRGRALTETEQAKIVRFLMAWIERELGGWPEPT